MLSCKKDIKGADRVKDKSKMLIIIGNVLLIVFCVLQVIIEIDSTFFSILIGFAVLLELIGIALGKKE